ncbi:MAG: ABC transporter ATP-binding protein [Actinomycetota bacterium]|nr:ABC transporter ATP-binding protein [Actinomycetota bacterium]
MSPTDHLAAGRQNGTSDAMTDPAPTAPDAPEAAPAAPGVRDGVAAIGLDGVRKVYPGRSGRDEVVAIDHIDVDVRPGEFCSIVGPSGCGKSTLLYIVAGFLEASGGSVRHDGIDVDGPGVDRGIVFQQYGLFPWKTVAGNVAEGLRARGAGRREAKREAARYLEMVGLADSADRYPKELSGGMQQRVAIARTLAQDPDVLLMDEPFGALDAQTRHQLQRELTTIWAGTTKTVLFVTHSVEEAIYLSDRIVVLTHRPSTVAEIIDVDIPRPRDREDILDHPRFAELHHRVWHLLEAPAADVAP